MSEESFDPPSLETLGQLLPAYDFEAFIAQGGMGAVYKARQRSLDRDVAIKILPRELGADPEFRQSFETEAKAMARLNHPNLISVYDFGDADGMPYIVMEYVNGKSLFHSAHNLAVEPSQAVTIVKGICDGLAHAHENGVIHRDIKPANILLTPKAEPKVGDFGLARPAGEGSTGLLMGTPGYTAPEVTRQPDHADRRSDIFALGVLLYELLIGRCPPYDVPPPPPSTVVGCDPALDIICAIAMHPAASMRYATAEAMSAALEQWQQGRNRVPAARTTATIARPVAHAPHHAPAEAAPLVIHKSRGNLGLVGQAAILAVLIVATAFAWKKLRGLQDERAAQQAAYHTAKAHEPEPEKPRGKPEDAKPAPKPVLPEASVTRETAALPDQPGAGTPPPAPDVAPADDAMAKTDDSAPSPLITEEEIDPADIAKPPAPMPPAIAELETKAKALVAALEKDREKELATNAKTFAWDLDSWLKTLNKGEQLEWKNDVENLKRLVSGNRVPQKVDTGSGISLSERMARIAEFCARKQQALDAVFESKAAKIRDAYVTRVSEAATKARESGDEETARVLEERASQSIELHAWLRIIHPEMEMVDPSLLESAAAVGSSDPLVGSWTWGGGETIIFRADGTGENQQSTWTASWRHTGESEGLRSYEISWKGGEYVDKIQLSSDARTISGWNQIGDRVEGERKD